MSPEPVVNPPLLAQVAQCLQRQGAGAGRLVVAVSGGPDSVALARALVALRPGGLILAHLNHQLRGAESDADEAFVQQLHATLRAVDPDLGWRCARLDVRAAARAEHGNEEAVARRLRYAWLAAVARDTAACYVATGHTADDQAETVLHRLLRGTGLKGLRGIHARRPLAPGVEVLRPLLTTTRADVLAYLAALGQPHRSDSSNISAAYTRNRIRHELLPLLAERFNPAIVAVLGRLAEQAAEWYEDEEEQAAALLAAAELPRAGALLVFDRPRLQAAPRRLVRAALRRAWEREGWPEGGMSFAAWERLAGVVCGEAAAVDLPGGVRARCRGRVVQLGPGS